jgi:hypothetical protein
MFMKGKGNVDTFSVNLYGSQRSIKRLPNMGEVQKALNSAKSNVSMNLSGRLDSGPKKILNRQNSIASNKSKLVVEILGKNKAQQVGKGLWNHLKKKMDSSINQMVSVNEKLFTPPKNGTHINFTQAAISAELAIKDQDPPNLPIQNLLREQAKVPTEGLELGRSFTENEGRINDLEVPKGIDMIKRSGSFEDFKSMSSHDTFSQEEPVINTRIGNSRSSMNPHQNSGRKQSVDKDKLKNIEENYIVVAVYIEPS